MPAGTVVHRQQREGPRREEYLIGDIVVGPLVVQHRDDCLMIVLPPGDPNSRSLARRRIAPVRSDQQRRPKLAPVLECHDDTVIATLDAGDA
jgi:hypothetical protein